VIKMARLSTRSAEEAPKRTLLLYRALEVAVVILIGILAMNVSLPDV